MKYTTNLTSNYNKYIKQVNLLKKKKERDKAKLFIAEGERLVNEIPSDWKIEYIILSEKYFKSLYKHNSRFLDNKVLTVSDKLFEKISDTVNPQGILAVCGQKTYSINQLLNKKNSFFVLLENIRDPGNLGTLIRTADAANADGVFLSRGCVDLYNSKVIRGAMGSIFHLPIIADSDFDILVENLKSQNISILAAHLKGVKTIYETDLTKGIGILVGNEANGLSEKISEKATELLKIPMYGQAESINVSAAGSIFIYEAVRQRIYSK